MEFFPDITPSTSAFTVVPAATAKYNPFSQVETIFDNPGDKWSAKLQWSFLRKAEVRDVRGFLNSLAGFGRFYLRDTAHQNLGYWASAITVSGANQYGKVLTVAGAPANTTFAPICDRFTIDGFLYELTQDATADANGKATLHFTPELRRMPLDGTVLITTDPYGTFMMKDPSQIPTFSQTKSGAKDVAIDLIEAIRS